MAIPTGTMSKKERYTLNQTTDMLMHAWEAFRGADGMSPQALAQQVRAASEVRSRVELKLAHGMAERAGADDVYIN